MSWLRQLAGSLLLLAISLCGCANNDSVIRPPKLPEEFRDPPDELRYTTPVQYPRDVLEEDMILKKAKDSNKQNNPLSGGPRGPGRMGGMGGMGMPN